MARITVNGVSYESIEAMPPDARRLYEQAMARLPELADRDGDGIPDIAEEDGLRVGHRTTVRRQFTVNGTPYDDVKAMPPDVREAYERAMRAAGAGGPNVTKSEVRLSFQLTGPGFRFQAGSGAPGAVRPAPPDAGPAGAGPRPAGSPIPAPIEPVSIESRVRFLLVVGACVAGGLLLWLLVRHP